MSDSASETTGFLSRMHGPTALGVPRWAVLTAYAVPLTVLPSGVWRVATILTDDGRRGSGELPGWMPVAVYVIALSVLSELLAYSAVGLVATWGEVWPRWVPFLHGRGVPTLAVVLPAAIGAIALTLIWTVALGCVLAGVTLQGDPRPADFPTAAGGWQAFIFYVAYLPLLLWGPLLAVLTVHYRRRRSTHPATSTSEHHVVA